MPPFQDNEDLPKAKLTKTSLRQAFRLFAYLKPDMPRYLLGLLFLGLTSATALAFPKLIGDLVNAASETGYEGIHSKAIVLMILLGAQSVFSFLRIYLFAQTTENSLLRLRTDLFSHLIRLPMSYFTQTRVGEINSRISADITQLQDTFSTTLADCLKPRCAPLMRGGRSPWMH